MEGVFDRTRKKTSDLEVAEQYTHKTKSVFIAAGGQEKPNLEGTVERKGGRNGG